MTNMRPATEFREARKSVGQNQPLRIMGIKSKQLELNDLSIPFNVKPTSAPPEL